MTRRDQEPLTAAAFHLSYELAEHETWDEVMGCIIPRALPASTAGLYAVGYPRGTTRIVDVLFVTRRYQKPGSVCLPATWRRRGAKGRIADCTTPKQRERRELFIPERAAQMRRLPFVREAGSVDELQTALKSILALRKRYRHPDWPSEPVVPVRVVQPDVDQTIESEENSPAAELALHDQLTEKGDYARPSP